MPGAGPDRKQELITRLAAMAGERLPPEKSGPGVAFLRAFYANVAFDDVAERSEEDLYGAAMALWHLGRHRRPGEVKIRIYNPRASEHGWRSPHSVVEIVNDDMPFLVDSVSSEINQHDLTVHLVVHPVIAVRRDEGGEMLALGTPGESGAVRESFMHVEIDEQTSPAAIEAIRGGLLTVLGDVRRTVADWRQIVERVKAVIADLEAWPPPVPEAEIRSACEFLAWLADDHFTFLGYREYEYVGEGAQARANVVPGIGLGLLHDDSYLVFDGLRNLATLPPEVQDFVRSPTLLKVTKSNRRSTVHRSAFLDTLGIKRYGADGRVIGERLFLGLFTSAVYNQSPTEIPLLRDKVKRAAARAGFAPASHDYRALMHILETFPRDELFQVSDDELLEIALGILHLQERQRIALFVRKDPFERFMSCLVFVPRDRYSTELRLRFQAILEQAFAGTVSSFASQFADDSALARVHFIVNTQRGQIPAFDLKELTRRLTEAGRIFRDRLQVALVEAHGEEHGLAALRRFADAFPSGYRERFPPAVAVGDIERIEEALASRSGLALSLYRSVEAEANELCFKIFKVGEPMPLSDILPVLEHMGLRVMTEVPYRVQPLGSPEPVWIHDFSIVARDLRELDLAQLKPLFEAAFATIWTGEAEDDGFNRLVLGAGLEWREVAVLRAYCKYLRQAGILFSQAYMEDTLAANPRLARRLIDLFKARFDPALRDGAKERVAGLLVEIDHLLDAVSNLDEDRILRRFLNLVRSTLRTNYFQGAAAGMVKPYLAFKLDSREVEELPLPRPLVEIFVASPRVEAVHLRGNRVARGGIRWSDRREDFRTEILGLMKAQMVKNAVIVPVGSKGGFVLKRPPADPSREALQTEVVECYRTMMRGLLDLTDNLVGDAVVAPPEVVRIDGDDPYLVVAADKGTATFSDLANGIARDYGFWLDDAFASGGSAGYDHKRMGITARGAWESVKRHFRELGLDPATTDFTVIGVGDMSGDVFGNGMLMTPHIRLLGAFDHRHILVDPDPDPAVSFAERRRLFDLPRSSWADYDPKALSPGGAVFERKAKSVHLSAAAQAAFGLESVHLTPAELIRAMLKAPVDLLWLGGIGTFVKSGHESHAEVGDRANDALRIDGRDLRARVVGEGANLGFTQRGRIEYARERGGRINTDAIDNSAGVDTSDHEVNIKILLGDVVTRGDMTLKQRDRLLAEMEGEVADLVLRDNYLQTQALSMAEAEGPAALDRDARLIRALEKAGRLNRAIEFLPDDEELTRRQAAGEGLTRPERAVLLAYAKIWLFDELMASDLPDDSYLVEDLLRYFPRPLRKTHAEAIRRHRLRREIIATYVNNSLINRAGACFVNDLKARTGASASDIARAYTAARQVLGLRPLWSAIEALDGRVAPSVQYAMLLKATRLVERASRWLLRTQPAPIDIGATLGRFEPAAGALKAALPQVLDPARAQQLSEEADGLIQQGVPESLASAVAGLDNLVAAFDLAGAASAAGIGIEAAAEVYFALGARLGLDWLRGAVDRQRAQTEWQKLAASAIRDDIDVQQAEAASRAFSAVGPEDAVARWSAQRSTAIQRYEGVLAEVKAAPTVDLAALTVVSRELRAAVSG